jgi:hypothetical protein
MSQSAMQRVALDGVELEAEVRGTGEPGRRAGLEFVEKLLTANLISTDTAERNAGVGSVPLVASLVNWESPRYSKPGNAG